MNKNHSNTELKYKKRWLGEIITSAVRSFPAVVISGARQVGKSTFLQNELSDFKYVSLDEFSNYKQAKLDVSSLWIDTDNIIIDEAQKVPEIFSAVKVAIDKSKRKKRFILSGSSNLLLMKRVTETLAGRAVYFELSPMLFGEIRENTEGRKNFLSLWENNLEIPAQKVKYIDPFPYLLKGFMPPILYLKEIRDVLLWWEGYIKTYIERDVRELSRIESLIDFRRVIELIALRTGNLVNQIEIARDSRVSQPTVHRYLNLLEVSNLIKRVPAYFKSRTKRIIKRPKIYFIDPALSVYLSGYHDIESLKNAREVGAFFENLVFMHLNALSEQMVPKARIYYFRSVTLQEVDFVIEHGNKLLAFEVKSSTKIMHDDIKNLLSFLHEYPETVRGVLIYAGDTIQWLHSKVVAVPWWWLA
jgi:predicted AAA+ superfamily ATPase